MYIQELKQLVKKYENFVRQQKGADKNIKALKEELWRVKCLIDMYESCGESMAFDIDQKARKLKQYFDAACEEEIQQGL